MACAAFPRLLLVVRQGEMERQLMWEGEEKSPEGLGWEEGGEARCSNFRKKADGRIEG